ncbi:MAG: hypothetical protein ACXWCO_00685 [Caldimonas sp.]
MKFLQRVVGGVLLALGLTSAAGAVTPSVIVQGSLGGARSTTMAVPASEAVGKTFSFLVRLNSGVAGNPIGAVTDDAAGSTNVYVVDKECDVGGSDTELLEIHTTLTTALTTSNHWTFTAGGATTPFGNVAVIDMGSTIQGVDAATCHAYTGANTSFPAGSITPVVAGDVFLGTIAEKGGTAITNDASYTALTVTDSFGTSKAGYLNEAGTTAHNYTPTTASQSNDTTSLLIAFRTAGLPYAPPSIGLLPGRYSSGPGQCPPIAAANNMCVQTWGFGPGTWTNVYADTAVGLAGNKRGYFDDAFGQSAATEAGLTTLDPAAQFANIGNGSNAYQNNFTSATAGTSGNPNKFVGKAFGGPMYIQCTASFTAANVNNGVWHAACWTYSIECETAAPGMTEAQWFGQAAGYQICYEGDVMEHFMGSFSNPITQYSATDHWHADSGRNTGLQDIHNASPSGGSAAFSSMHKYGLLITPATNTTNGTHCYDFDDGAINLGCTSYPKFEFQVPAGGSFTSGVGTSIPMSSARPDVSTIVWGYDVYDRTTSQDCGKFSSWSGSTVVTQGTITCTGAANDVIQFTPPAPVPASAAQTITGGVTTAITMATSNPNTAVVQPGYDVYDLETSALNGCNVEIGTVLSYVGTTLTLTAPASHTSCGANDILWFMPHVNAYYGSADFQHQAIIAGGMDSTTHILKEQSIAVWQADDNSNILGQ